MNQINERDGAPHVYLRRNKGRFELDPESSEQNENCVCARLIQAWYDSSSLASVGEKSALSMDLIYRAVYPKTDPSQVINKMKPDCLKLVGIIQKCKFKISATTATNGINKDDENAFNKSFAHKEIGGFERLYQE